MLPRLIRYSFARSDANDISRIPLNPGTNINNLQNFAADHQDWVGIIESEAIKSLQKAYKPFGIRVHIGSKHVDIFNNQVPDEEFHIYVVGKWPPPGAGKTFTNSSSNVYYFSLMDGAQEALGRPGTGGAGWVDFIPAYPPTTAQTTADFVNLLTAMGRAIGNAAAHEIGHHLEKVNLNGGGGLPLMDCGAGNTSAPVSCEDNNNFVYNFWNADGFPQDPLNPSSNGGQFFYIDVTGEPSIHWGPSDMCWLQNYVFAGSCKRQ